MTPYIVAGIISAFIISILVYTKITKNNKAQKKGEKGEKTTTRLLNQLPKNNYMVLNDIFIQNGKYYSQIDHIVISKSGIFVIETKNYTGLIFGEESDYQWTQMIGNNYKVKIINPVRQNLNHIRTLSALLPKTEYHSIIVMGKNASPQVHSSVPVINHDMLLSTITRHRKAVLTINEMKQIYDTIIKNNITSEKARKKYIKQLQKKYNHQ